MSEHAEKEQTSEMSQHGSYDTFLTFLEFEGSHALGEEVMTVCGVEHRDEKRYITSTSSSIDDR